MRTAILKALESFFCTVKYKKVINGQINEVTTLYVNNSVNQIGGEGDARPCALPRACTRAPLPHVKLVTDGRKTWLVGEDGESLGIFTKSLVAPPKRLHEFLLQDQSCKLLPKHRVCNCLKKRIDKNKNRSVKYNVDRKKSHWSNVQRCASLWVCPVCAKPITEGRRSELTIGLDRWKNEFFGGAILLTLTFSHSIDMPLAVTQLGLRKAYQYFVEHRQVKKIFEALKVKHKIKGQEVTWGENGWHPHNHILLLTEHKNVGFAVYRDQLAKIWIDCCVKAGLRSPSMKHGLDLQDGSYAEQYVSKWGLPEEMSKGHIKQGRNGGYTPFDLLELSIEDKPIHGKLPSKLFQEFAVAMKGQRQLVWGRGLKKLLRIDEKTDEEHAQETEKNAIELVSVANYAFNLLPIYQKRHTYLDLVTADHETGSNTANALLDELHQKYITKIVQTE